MPGFGACAVASAAARSRGAARSSRVSQLGREPVARAGAGSPAPTPSSTAMRDTTTV